MRRGLVFRLVAVAAIVVASAAAIYAWPMKLGLDLQGGTRLVLEAHDTETVKVDEDAVLRAKEVIERRVNQLGVAEPVIYRQGPRRVVVELAGVDPQSAVKVIGTTAMLEWKDESGNVVLTGNELKNAQVSYDNYSRPVVAFQLTKEGARKFEKATRENLGRKIGIYLDKQMISNPIVNAIIKDAGIIEGMPSVDEAKYLAMMLRAGALPVPMDMVENRSLGPVLGQESIDQSKIAAIIGIAMVTAYMVGIYKLPGIMADLALVVYGGIVLAVMAALRATLTLPGIAGLILSVGMAVDANVIIFERIKEELRAGKRVRAAVDAGHARAWACILDSNVTTLITAVVLYILGTGPVRGFAVTLSLGILASMFSSIVVTRTILTALIDKNPDRYAASFGA